jgi:hypothetical protein
MRKAILRLPRPRSPPTAIHFKRCLPFRALASRCEGVPCVEGLVNPFCRLDYVLMYHCPFRFPSGSIPVAPEDGFGLCVELVLPIPSASGEPAVPFSTAEGAPPVSAAKETMLEPMRTAKVIAAVAILRCITHSIMRT